METSIRVERKKNALCTMNLDGDDRNDIKAGYVEPSNCIAIPSNPRLQTIPKSLTEIDPVKKR